MNRNNNVTGIGVSARMTPGVRAGVVLLAILLTACSAKTPVESGLALARQEPVQQIPGYLTAPAGGPLQDSLGRCWRTADWRPALAIEACDPALVRERKVKELALALAAVTAPGSSLEAPPGPAAVAGAPDAASAGTEAGVAPGDAAGTGSGSPGLAADAAAGTAAIAAARSAAAVAMGAPLVQSDVKPGYITKPVVLNTDAAFFFGKDRLSPAGKDAVENLAAYIKLWGIEDITVEVIGHSDRIGNARDNQALSVRRAQAVKEVLAGAGVPAGSIVASGVGSTQPLTAPDACPDDLDRCELINCLAPDRRVVVGLKGTRKAPAR